MKPKIKVKRGQIVRCPGAKKGMVTHIDEKTKMVSVAIKYGALTMYESYWHGSLEVVR